MHNADEKRYGNGMVYRRCGRSGLKLPIVSLGLWHNFGSIDDFENQKRMIFKAFDLGITHFDLANNYGPVPGSAEENFGRILNQEMKHYRDEMIISTKAGYVMWEGPYGDKGSRKYLTASLDQSLHPLEGVGCHTHTCCHTQTSLGVFAGMGLVLCLGDVLIGDESDEFIVAIDHGKFLNLVFEQDARCTLKVCLLMGDHEVFLRHHVINLLVQICLETKVTVGHNADKGVDIIYHRDTTNVILMHDVEGILHGRATLDGDRIVNHTVFGTFHDGNLTSLLLYRHILMNHADTTFTGNGDCHGCLCDSVHGCCHKWNLQFNITRELGGKGDFTGKDL